MVSPDPRFCGRLSRHTENRTWPLKCHIVWPYPGLSMVSAELGRQEGG